MAFTKINFYLTIVLSAVLVFGGLAIIGTDANSNTDLDLNDKSIDYILELKGIQKDDGYSVVSNRSSEDSANKGVLDDGSNSSVSGVQDLLSALFIKKERANDPTNFFKVVYNIPSSVLKALGLPIDDFKYIINSLVFALLIGIIIMVWRDIIRT